MYIRLCRLISLCNELLIIFGQKRCPKYSAAINWSNHFHSFFLIVYQKNLNWLRNQKRFCLLLTSQLSRLLVSLNIYIPTVFYFGLSRVKSTYFQTAIFFQWLRVDLNTKHLSLRKVNFVRYLLLDFKFICFFFFFFRKLPWW